MSASKQKWKHLFGSEEQLYTCNCFSCSISTVPLLLYLRLTRFSVGL